MKRVISVTSFMVSLLVFTGNTRAVDKPVGMVSFQGVMLESPGCTLEMSTQRVVMGNIYPSQVPLDGVSHWTPVAFRVKDCNKQTRQVSVTMNYVPTIYPDGGINMIANDGDAWGVWGVLAPRCDDGRYRACKQSVYDSVGIESGSTLVADIVNGEALLPLKVGLTRSSLPDMILTGSLSSVVSFTFTFD
ncbi:Uncharacterised protein [Citrobacter freundii]|nr:Uncharacterised protein [Citrobacter freundii]